MPAPPPDDPPFIVDAMLGRLARWLRLFGYDTVYKSDIADEELAWRSLKEGRILLTRDAGFGRRRPLRLVLIRGERVQDQVRQVLRELRLKPSPERFFTRCSVCNSVLVDVEKGAVKEVVPSHVFQTRNRFSKCAPCEKIYWLGSHQILVKQFIERELDLK